MTPHALPQLTRTSRPARRRRHGRRLLAVGFMIPAMAVAMLVMD